MSDIRGVPDVTHYSYRVLWSAEDQEFVALCTEFPSLSWLAATQELALEGIRERVGEIVADMSANGVQIPEPLSERGYSGRFLVRTSPRLHARLAQEAAEMNVSLNQLANQRLAAS